MDYGKKKKNRKKLDKAEKNEFDKNVFFVFFLVAAIHKDNKELNPNIPTLTFVQPH